LTRILTALVLTASLPALASAHPGRSLHPGEVWAAWTWDPWVLLGIGVPAWLYARGVGRVWRRAGRGRGVGVWQFRAFCAGLVTLGVALISPVHAVGGALFWVHMVQHELLILIAAPLLALGAPAPAFAWSVPRRLSIGVSRSLRRPPLRVLWAGASHPLGAWTIHAVALWVWHVPALYQAALSSELVHAAQHLSFFVSAMLFWWVLFHLRRSPAGYGIGIVFLFTTMLHSNALGALLTFSLAVWYPEYAATAARWGLTALEDQQLGGLIMWIPAGAIYLGAALLLLAGWLRGEEHGVLDGEVARAEKALLAVEDPAG
jgi:putative membrane protein